MKEICSIEFNDVSLIYDLNYEGVNSLKETVINFFHRRKPPVERPAVLYALDNVNVRIQQGERVGIIGLNGSGKSTFLKAASRILRPQRGSVEVRGKVQPLIEIGAGFNPEFSGRENIYLNGAMLGFSPAQIREREQEIIDFAELRDFIDLPVKYYSSGMSVRLAFTIATIVQPEILLMDEMLSAGDLSFIEKAKRRIDQILNKAKILVLVSHDLGLVASITTRCLVMEKGKVVFDGETERALEYYKMRTQEKVERTQQEEEERRREEEARRQAAAEAAKAEAVATEEAARIPVLGEVFVHTQENSTEFQPDAPMDFSVGFRLTADCDEVYINLSILTRIGFSMLHFRNDFQGLRFKNCKAGSYEAEIKVPNFPLKSGDYTASARIVAIYGSEREIVDSPGLHFKILGNKIRDTITPNLWTFRGPGETMVIE